MEPTKKILSVIIPAYNSHAFIKNALETLDYKYSDLFDVIIIDDLSPIPLEPEIRDYLAQHNNISIHRHEQNLNWGGAVETGFKLANSLYVKILDSDDQFDTETFVKYILVLKNYAEKDIDIFITNTSCYLGDEFWFSKKIGKKNNIIKITNFDEYHISTLPTMHSFTFRKDFVINCFPLLYNTPYTDNILIFRAIEASNNIAIMPSDFYLYKYIWGVHEQSMSLPVLIKNLEKLQTVILEMCNQKIKQENRKRNVILVKLLKEIIYLYHAVIFLNNGQPVLKKLRIKNAFNNKLKKHYKKNYIVKKLYHRKWFFFLRNFNVYQLDILHKIAFYASAKGFLGLIKKCEKIRKNDEKIVLNTDK